MEVRKRELSGVAEAELVCRVGAVCLFTTTHLLVVVAHNGDDHITHVAVRTSLRCLEKLPRAVQGPF